MVNLPAASQHKIVFCDYHAASVPMKLKARTEGNDRGFFASEMDFSLAAFGVYVKHGDPPRTSQ